MNAAKRITITDVAEAAGVSAGTASRVLNQRDGDIKISEATRAHVLEVAQQLGYRPNPFAAALRTQRTGVLGVIVRDLTDPYLGMLAREIQKAVRARGMDVLFAHAEYDLEVVGHHLAFMHSHWFDGLLLLGDMPGDEEILQELQTSKTPFVAVARGEQTRPPLVNIDEAAGVRAGLDYLTGLGHQRIAFLGNLDHGGVKERLELFRKYFQEHPSAAPKQAVQTCANSRSAALECAQALVRSAQPPTAIFCATDLAALGAISGVQRLGMDVPRDVSILGFDDIEGSADGFPALTTIRQPVGEMAQQAVGLLMQSIEGASVPENNRRILIEPKLIVRQSCSSPR